MSDSEERKAVTFQSVPRTFHNDSFERAAEKLNYTPEEVRAYCRVIVKLFRRPVRTSEIPKNPPFPPHNNPGPTKSRPWENGRTSRTDTVRKLYSLPKEGPSSEHHYSSSQLLLSKPLFYHSGRLSTLSLTHSPDIAGNHSDNSFPRLSGFAR